jgi:hypothetical protein
MKIWRFTNLEQTNFSYLSSVVLSFVFIILSGLLVWSNSDRFPLVVPLWFSKPWGEERLAPPTLLWLIPLLSLAFTLVNLMLGSFFGQREKVLSLVLIWSSPVISALFFYTLFEIISVVA